MLDVGICIVTKFLPLRALQLTRLSDTQKHSKCMLQLQTKQHPAKIYVLGANTKNRIHIVIAHVSTLRRLVFWIHGKW